MKDLSFYRNQLETYLEELGIDIIFSDFISYLSFSLILLLFAFTIDWVAKRILLGIAERISVRTKTNIDDLLIEKGVLSGIAHLIPILFFFKYLPQIFVQYKNFSELIYRLGDGLFVFTIIIILYRLLNVFRELSIHIKSLKDKPIDSFIQLFKIIIGVVLGVAIISILLDQSIKYIFGAFGAASAVLLLVFKDSILGFIASIQLSANGMIILGDWVQMEKYGADGNVEEINLTTVKVKNWDKTVTTVPTYAFISDSFKNWRGMEETGARRIARSIYINQNSVKFATKDMIDSYKSIHILKDYIKEKEQELDEYNKQQKVDSTHLSNGRRLTNLGTFRAYLVRYLKNHPKIDQNQTLIVRQLQPTENGVPIQIYAFSSDIAWVNYEGIQSDIFDHTMAVASQFELEIFQNPSGSDFKKALS